MTYTRKTHDEWQVHASYGYGWEEVTSYSTRKEAIQGLKEYRENEPQYPHKIIKVRVRI